MPKKPSNFQKALDANKIPYTVIEYNSNNAWGFGGTTGQKFIYREGFYTIVGRAGTRHHGTFPHITTTLEDRWLCDRFGHGKRAIDANIEEIKKYVESEATPK